MKLPVVISGYYGFDNLGDEAILAAILKLLKRLRNDLQITVLSQKPEITAKRYGVRAVNRNDLLKISKELRQSRLFISGGGSLLQDVTSWRSVPYYLSLIYLARFLGNKTALYAQGIGPLNKKFSRKLVKWVANRTDLVMVRDSNSAALMRKIGVNNKLIEETVDPVYSLADKIDSLNKDINPEEVLNNYFGENFKEKKIIGLSVRPWGNNNYLKAIARAGDYLAEISEAEIIILPMYLEEDRDSCYRVKEMMNHSAFLFDKKLTPIQMIAFFNLFDFFLGVRLHSLIFAAVNRIPLLGISYDPKVDSFLSSLDLNRGLNTQNLSYDRLKEVITDFWEEQDLIVEKLDKKMKIYSSRVEKDLVKVLQLVD